MTDRFAVAVATPLRVRGCALAGRFGLRTQTHLNEQLGEKELVETKLYPQRRSYTDVYRGDGLLDHECILAHCIHMRPEEWQIVADAGSAIAHCPTSNVMLGSGVMSLDTVVERQIPYAIATDVGASPTVSMLAEMGRFLQVHAGGSIHATPSEALWRATLGPAEFWDCRTRWGGSSRAGHVVHRNTTSAASFRDDRRRNRPFHSAGRSRSAGNHGESGDARGEDGV